MHQRAGLNLPSSKPSGRSWSNTVLRARGRGTGPRSLARSTARRRVKGSPGCPTLEGEEVNRVANRFLS